MSAFPAIDAAIGRRVLDLVRGCTFDDFIMAPQRSVIARRDPSAIDLSCRLSRRITLNRPIVSANMDTVTRAPMAIVQAEEGGIGIIDRGFRPGEIAPQVVDGRHRHSGEAGTVVGPVGVGVDHDQIGDGAVAGIGQGGVDAEEPKGPGERLHAAAVSHAGARPGVVGEHRLGSSRHSV